MWIALAGLVPIALVLRDLFHTLFHPGGAGTISGILQRGVWLGLGRLPRRDSLLAVAGPLAVAATIGVWFFLAAAGWALVYWPYLPDAFRFATPLDAGEREGYVDALYLAITTQSTLGFGDVTATARWLQLVTALQAVAGFTILTVSLTWIVSIYPALGRRRALAGRTTALLRALDESGREVPAPTLEGLAADVVRVRADQLQNPILYRFRTSEPDLALPAVLPRLHALAERRLSADDPETAIAAAALLHAIEGLARTLATEVLGVAERSTEEQLAAFARDHAYGAAA